MSKLALLIPTRGRPKNIERILTDLEKTETEATLILGLDLDDPALDDYLALVDHPAWRDTRPIVGVRTQTGMVDAINRTYHAVKHDFDHFAFTGDDVHFATRHWDREVLNKLDNIGAGVVYWDDLKYGQNLCTHWAITGSIGEALDNFAPPVLHHLYVDNFFYDLGKAIGSLHYLPYVVIEHLHPLYLKSDMDDQYKSVQTDAIWKHDEQAHGEYLLSEEYAVLVATLKELVTSN